MAHRLARVALTLATLASTASLVSAGSRVDQYVVSFPPDDDNATTFVSELFAASPAARVFERLRGAVLPLRASQARALRERHPDAIVERDARVAAQGFRSTRASLGVHPTTVTAQSRRLPWGLDRVDQRALPLDGRASRHPDAGAGALLYVVDSGVTAAHVDFTGRVVASIHARPAESPAARARADAAGGDCYGHGTAVASLAAGASSGLAPAARIVSVRVLDCAGNGRVSDVVAGLEAVVEHVEAERARDVGVGDGDGDGDGPRRRPRPSHARIDPIDPIDSIDPIDPRPFDPIDVRGVDPILGGPRGVRVARA